ncbi:MAG: long-chain fatty acid--CoA ligase [Deltaproteobacteria bacterium]|nr:long-chain fatty acid--CoA ligase [Deltaproteobacteria bacterium]
MPTVLHRLNRWAVEAPESTAQRFKEWSKQNSPWKTYSAREFMDRVFHLAVYLESRGIRPGDSGAIYSYNCPQWVQLELALMLIRAKSAGIYPNSTQKDVLYVLNHTEAKVVGVQDHKYFSKIGTDHLPKATSLVLVFDGDTSVTPNAVRFDSAIEEGRKFASGKRIEDYLSRIDVNDGAFLIYTSGTTGEPKGAILSHDNLAFTADAAIQHWELPKSGGNLFSFLPLCHIAEKLQNIGVGLSCRYPVSFCSKMEHLAIELQEVKPSLLLCVPRVWEKIMEGVKGKVAKATGVKKILANWALAVGARVAEKRYAGKTIGPVDRACLLVAHRLVIGKILGAIGLDNVKLGASGAAALPAHVSRWFRALGIEILEDFGQTESTGIACMTRPGVESAGTVGIPVIGTEFRIADDGEVLTRGRHVFKGYFKNDAATREVLSEDGWLFTGDLAEYTDRGLVRIRGRKKEIMKTSGGKMIAPLPIEDQIKSSDLISQVCMVGDGRKYVSALVTLSETILKEMQSRDGAVDGLVVKDESVLSSVRKHVDGVNRTLASYEKIKYFTVLSRDFSIEEGEMTPTLKMKRSVIENRFRDLIDRMYSVPSGAKED